MTAEAAHSQVSQKGEFISFFLFQCERITLPNSRRRLRPPRTILAHLASIEPFLFSYIDPTQLSPERAPRAEHRGPPPSSHLGEEEELELLSTMPPTDDHGDVLDLSTFYPGSFLCTALFRALAFFKPKHGSPTGNLRLALNLIVINVSQCGLDNESIDALCGLLGTGRCVRLEAVVLDRNEYVAVEAGQMLLRMLGVRGALGDGAAGKSHRLRLAGNASVSSDAGAAPAASQPQPSADADALEACDTTIMEGSLPVHEALPCLQCISLLGTNCPPHYVRRIEGLVRDMHSEQDAS
jgi:hypothetical protein